MVLVTLAMDIEKYIMVRENKPNGVGLSRVVRATYCSIKGLKAAFREEPAFKQELLLTVCLLPCSFFLAESINHWALLIGSLLLVLVVELINSAIEAVTDRVGTEYHVLSGRAKDMASAGVTLTLLIVVIVWGAAIADSYF